MTTSPYAPSTLGSPPAASASTPTQPKPTLMQRRNHLHHTVTRLLKSGTITDFCRTAGSRTDAGRRAGYAVRYPGSQGWVCFPGIAPMQVALDLLESEHLARG